MATDPKILDAQAARAVPVVEILSPKGEALLDASSTAVAVGEPEQFGFTEGPVFTSRGTWIFSDIPMATQYEFKPSTGALDVYRKPSNNSNGNFMDNTGRLLSCEHQARVLSRTDLVTGAREVVASQFGGKRLTSPNDCICSRKSGLIYFSDPAYGTMEKLGHGSPSEQESNNVYMLDPSSGDLTVLDSSFVQPNGLCFNPGIYRHRNSADCTYCFLR